MKCLQDHPENVALWRTEKYWEGEKNRKKYFYYKKHFLIVKITSLDD